MNRIYHHLHSVRETELNELYVSNSIRTFALSIISIFIPIYLYLLGYSYASIFFFYFLVKVFEALGEYPAGRLIGRYGAKHILAMSFPATALNFILLMTLDVYHWPIWVLALSTSIPLNLFWMAYHSDFSKAKDDKNAGKEIGKISILTSVVGSFGPVVGGILASSAGMPATILIVVVLLLVAAVPLFLTSEITTKRVVSMNNFSIRKNFRDLIGYGGYGLEVISVNVVWPLFLFLVVKDFLKVGSIATISLIVMVAGSIFIAKMTDKYEKKKVIKVAAYFNCLTSGSRILASSPILAYIIGIFSSVGHILLYVPLVCEYYIHADKQPRLEYITGMEIAIDIGTALGFLVLLIATMFLEIREVLFLGFVVGALGSLLSTNIAERNDSKTESISVVAQ